MKKLFCLFLSLALAVCMGTNALALSVDDGTISQGVEEVFNRDTSYPENTEEPAEEEKLPDDTTINLSSVDKHITKALSGNKSNQSADYKCDNGYIRVYLRAKQSNAKIRVELHSNDGTPPKYITRTLATNQVSEYAFTGLDSNKTYYFLYVNEKSTKANISGWAIA